jgi:hypothetical protein
MIFSPGRLPAGCLTASTEGAACRVKGCHRNSAPRRRQQGERRRVLRTRKTPEDSSPLPLLLIMTLECGTTVFPASHAGKFRDISGVFPPTWAILPKQEKTKQLS